MIPNNLLSSTSILPKSFSPHNDYISSPQQEDDIVKSIYDEMDCTQEVVVPTG
jgi:hypothetical protein